MTIGPSISIPCFWISSYTMTASPAAGPLTCRGQPDSAPVSRPPTIPVISPAAGGAPDAIAMPMQRGSATRNTTTDASRSDPSASRNPVFPFMFWPTAKSQLDAAGVEETRPYSLFVGGCSAISEYGPSAILRNRYEMRNARSGYGLKSSNVKIKYRTSGERDLLVRVPPIDFLLSIMNKIRVLLVDDHGMVRQGFRLIPVSGSGYRSRGGSE
jgi:hypothetical protein